MAGDNLRVSDGELLDQVAKLQNAITAYNELGESPLGESIAALESMNTDFIARLVTMLRNLNDRNPAFLEALDGVKETTEDIANNLRQVDKDGAESLGF
jgi:hypothetical protein